MEILVWAGGALSMLGMAGLVWCVLRVLKSKRQGLPEEELRAVLQTVIPYNMGALALSVLGLILVMVGLMLG